MTGKPDGNLASAFFPFVYRERLKHRRDEHRLSTSQGVKGAGEAGAIGAPPAVVNAIVDALCP